MKTILMKGWRAISAIAAYLLDIIAPPDEAVQAIEAMPLEEFIRAALQETPTPKPIEGILHLFPYRTEIMKTALVEIKTNYNMRLVRLVAQAAHERLFAHLGPNTESPYILIPIPMTRKKVRERGWNQCELVCKELAKLNPLFEYRNDILIKIRETADQVGKDRAGRFENLKDSCRVREKTAEDLRDRNIIVLDDIVTTGSTLSEAQRALQTGGTRSITCIAVAH